MHRTLLLPLFLACTGSTVYLPGTDPGSLPADVTDPGQPDARIDPGLPPDPGQPVCIAANNGRIEASGLPVAVGAAPTFVVNPAGSPIVVDVDGIDTHGKRLWDFTGLDLPVKAAMGVYPPSGYWFASHFPEATFASPLSAQDTSVLGVYQADDQGVRLMGIASSQESPVQGRTLLVYDSPVPLFTFPLEVGAVYGAKSSFKDALLYGVPNAGEEEYTFTVDALGTVKIPAFSLDNTLRIRVEVSQRFVVAPSPDPIRSVQYIFVHECMGEVARAASPPGVSDIHFESAKEFRRIGM
jgi:hypothetical protein